MINEQELWLIIQAKSNLDKAVSQAKGQLQGLEQQSKITTSKINQHTGSLVGGFNDFLHSVGQVRFALYRLSFIIGIIAGIGKTIDEARKSLDEMRASSRELEMSFSDLQRYKTGIVWSESDLKNLRQSSEAMRQWGQGIKNFFTALGVGFAKIFPKGQITTLGKDSEDVLKKMKDATDKLTLSTEAYNQKRFYLDYGNYKDILGLELNLSEEQRSIRENP